MDFGVYFSSSPSDYFFRVDQGSVFCIGEIIMPTQSYTKINLTNGNVQLRRNSFPTLSTITWGSTAANNSESVNLATSGIYDAASNTVWFLGGADAQTITGRSTAVNKADGGDGNDTITGGGLADWLYGSGGNDSLKGGGGDDRLSGGIGADTVLGEAGADFIYGDDGNDSLSGGSGNDTMNGGAGNDNMNGDAGTDVLFGGDNDDIVNGGDGADFIYGDAGNDRLLGGNDNVADTLVGGTGADTLNGGRGQDAFVFNKGDSTVEAFDTIESFALGFDKIWIDWANYETTVTQSAPLIVDIKQEGKDAALTFNFDANNSGIDYKMILKGFSVATLGTGATFQQNLTNMFVVYDASDVTYPIPNS